MSYVSLLKESVEFKLLFSQSEHLLQGLHSSKQKGDGIEFFDLREYCAGDDPRRIDWKVTARLQEPFVREFQEDRDAVHHVFLDCSASVKNKLLPMQVLAASSLLSSYKQADALSLTLFSGSLFPSSTAKGKKHLSALLYRLSQHLPSGKADMCGLFFFILSTFKKRCIITLISDEMEFDEEALSLLAQIARRHKVIFFHVYNSSEKELSFGQQALEDSESGEELLFDLSDEQVMKYQILYDSALRTVREQMKRIGVRLFQIDAARSLQACLKGVRTL